MRNPEALRPGNGNRLTVSHRPTKRRWATGMSSRCTPIYFVPMKLTMQSEWGMECVYALGTKILLVDLDINTTQPMIKRLLRRGCRIGTGSESHVILPRAREEDDTIKKMGCRAAAPPPLRRRCWACENKGRSTVVRWWPGGEASGTTRGATGHIRACCNWRGCHNHRFGGEAHP